MLSGDHRLLVDSDVFVLLGGTALLESAVSILGFGPGESAHLPALSNMLGRGRAFRSYPADIVQYAQLACAAFPSLPNRPQNDELFQRLLKPNIESGEALLIALLVENGNWLLTTGDKRALRALCNDPALSDVRSAVAGRVICLETIIRLLVTQKGVDAVRLALQPVVPIHQTLRTVFSPGNPTLDGCLEGLDSHLRALDADLGTEFLWKPAVARH